MTLKNIRDISLGTCPQLDPVGSQDVEGLRFLCQSGASPQNDWIMIAQKKGHTLLYAPLYLFSCT